MKYGCFLKKGSTIGLVAPSFGAKDEPYYSRLKNAIKRFKELGYNIKEGKNIWSLNGIRSASKKERALEFMDMYLDPNVDIIWSVGGGEVMLEILPYIDFKTISISKPKYFIGFSDNTNLTMLLTTICDNASIYYENFTAFGMEPLCEELLSGLNLIEGKTNLQKSFIKYEIIDLKHTSPNPLIPYNMTEPVKWKVLKSDETSIKGRLLGGCLDCLLCHVGTNFDYIEEFVSKYHKDGILWYLETCDLNSISTYRGLLQLKNASWFKNANGFIFGRPANTSNPFSYTIKDAISEALGDLNVPIIYDACFGHVSPVISIINGSFGIVKCKDEKGSLEMFLE